MVVLKLVWVLLFGLACAAPREGFEQLETKVNVKGLSQLNQKDICGLAPLGKKYKHQILSKPWMALLMYKLHSPDDYQRCAGTLITNRHVLTSAGCIHRVKSTTSTRKLRVRLGDQHKYKYFGVKKIIIHKDYNSTEGQHDIALVKLSKDVQFEDHIRPICLPISKRLFEEAISGQDLYITNWNSQHPYSPAFGTLHDHWFNPMPWKISVNEIFSESKCTFETGDPVTSLLHVPVIQIGIVSYDVCHRPKDPMVSTNVAKYIPWISEKIEE